MITQSLVKVLHREAVSLCRFCGYKFSRKKLKMVAEASDSVMGCGFPSTDVEWPSLEKRPQTSNVPGNKKRNNVGVSRSCLRQAEISAQSGASGKDLVEDNIETKKRSFRPAPHLKMCTVVHSLPTKMILHSQDHFVLRLDNFSSSADTFEDDFLAEILTDYWDEKMSVARPVTWKGCRSVQRRIGGVLYNKQLLKRDIRCRNRIREEMLAEARVSKKANIERKLEASGNRRRGPPSNYAETTVETRLPNQGSQTNSPGSTGEHVLHENEVGQYTTSKDEQELLRVLAIMQHRDLSPEDYELLLRLDESVSPKTVSKNRLNDLRTKVLTNADLADIMNHFAGARCTVCMELYYADQIVKWLPCDHVFHSRCIDEWLGESGSICPLDGLEV